MIGLLMDIPVGSAPAATGILTAAVSFFFAAVAMAYVAFRVLKRSIRSAIRMVVVAAILIVAVMGGVSIYLWGSAGKPATKPAASRTR